MQRNPRKRLGSASCWLISVGVFSSLSTKAEVVQHSRWQTCSLLRPTRFTPASLPDVLPATFGTLKLRAWSDAASPDTATAAGLR